MHMWSTIGALAIFLLVTFVVAAVGSLGTARGLPDWYDGLAKPPWTPPGWLFGPVWTALYAMMATAAWLVWRREGLRGAALPLGLYGVQLALNAVWPLIFFAMRSPGPAFGEIIILWGAVLATTIAFWQHVPAAGWLMVPYLVWTTFASALNFAIWRMNLSGP